MHANRLEFLAPGIGDGGFAAVGEHDRRAVGGVQRKQRLPGRHLRYLSLREQRADVLRADRLHIGDAAVTEMSECFGGYIEFGFAMVHVVTIHAIHGPRLLSMTLVESLWFR